MAFWTVLAEPAATLVSKAGRPRVMHLLNSRHFNGAENVVATLMSGLAEHWESRFVTRQGPVEESVRARGLPFEGLSRLSRAEVGGAIRRFRPDLIHAHDYRASLVAATFGVPVISHLHNNYPWARRFGPGTLAYRFALGRFERVIAVSPEVVGEHFFRRALARRAVVVENGVDLARIRTASEEFAPGCDLVFVGRLTEQKDPLAFIRIVAALQSAERVVTAILLGAGELMDTCREAVATAGLAGVCEVAGYAPNPYPIIAASRLCVMPSRWEGFGLAAVEALALGVPVLARPVGGLARVVGEVSPDLLCPDEPAFIARATDLLANEPRRRALGERVSTLAAARYSSAAMLRGIEAVYQDALSLQ